MTYSCEIIKDLLPLYIDEVASEDSKNAVKQHLEHCESCRYCYEAMKSEESFVPKLKDNSEDKKMADSLKNIKNSINKRLVITALAAMAVIAVGFNLLFNVPLKNIALKDITVSAENYDTFAQIKENGDFTVVTGEQVVISNNETRGNEKYYRIEIPSMPNADIRISEDLAEETDKITVIKWTCPYFIREISYADKTDEGTLYIDAFKTTLLDNKAAENLQTTMALEFKEIEKIVFLDGQKQTILWDKN